MKISHPAIPRPPVILLLLSILFLPGTFILLILFLGIYLGLSYWVITSLVMHGKFLYLAILFLIGLFAGIFGILRGIFAALWRRSDFEPAILIDKDVEIRFMNFIKEICDSLDTRLPRSIIFQFYPSGYVTQGKIKVFNGKAKGRILCIGMPLIETLTVNEFRAFLAHEFAHFSGKDTLYSSLTMPIYNGTIAALQHLDDELHSPQAFESFWIRLPMMPVFSILMVYIQIFHKLNMKISRKMEYRADAISVCLCGKNTSQVGLVKGVQSITMFNQCLKENTPFHRKHVSNIYALFRESIPEYSKNTDYMKDYIRPVVENEYATHPSLFNRLMMMPDIPDQYSDTQSAYTLISYLQNYQTNLTNRATLAMAGYKRK